MHTTKKTIRTLRDAEVLTDQGLDLSVLEEVVNIESKEIAVTSFAIIWELARRYNLTYRVRKDGRFVFESKEAWILEAKWFAAEIMRDWSGSDLPWLMRAHPPNLPEAPNREGNDDEHKRGQLPWMIKETAYNIHLMVTHRIESGYLNDDADLDPFMKRRVTWVQSPKNKERFKYKPFRAPACTISIAPKAIERCRGRVGRIEKDVIYLPGRREPRPGHYAREAARMDERFRLGREISWMTFLLESKKIQVESEGFDPSKLFIHQGVSSARLESLKKAWDEAGDDDDDGTATDDGTTTDDGSDTTSVSSSHSTLPTFSLAPPNVGEKLSPFTTPSPWTTSTQSSSSSSSSQLYRLEKNSRKLPSPTGLVYSLQSNLRNLSLKFLSVKPNNITEKQIESVPEPVEDCDE